MKCSIEIDCKISPPYLLLLSSTEYLALLSDMITCRMHHLPLAVTLATDIVPVLHRFPHADASSPHLPHTATPSSTRLWMVFGQDWCLFNPMGVATEQSREALKSFLHRSKLPLYVSELISCRSIEGTLIW